MQERYWRPLAALALLVFAALFGQSLEGQSIQGSIIGTVKDTAGAVVPGASVVLTSLDQGTVRTTTSNDSGDYQFGDAKAGKYSIEVTLAGFEKWTTRGLVLAARQQLRVDPALAVGNVQQEVTVSAEAIGTINTDNATVSAVYSAIEASNLPVNTRASAGGTSAYNIIGTLPGVQADHGQFSLQGGLPFQADVTVDGITVKSAGGGDTPIADAFPSTESIAELRTDGAQNNAEFGSPGEVTITTKGGSNTIHGSAFWYHQNAAFDAIPYTYITTTNKPKLVANTYGGSFSGPVVIPHLYNGHNKTFIFGDYEGWRHPAQVTSFYKVPSTLMKQGDFSKYSSPGFTGLKNPFTGGSYGTMLPSINSAAQKLLTFYPDPNVGDPTAYSDDGTPNYQVNKDASAHSDQFDIRGDQYIGSNQKFLVWGRYSYKNYPQNSAEPLAVPSAQNTNINHVLKISVNYTIKPTLINEFSFGFVRSTSGQSNSFDGKAFTKSLGLNGLQNLFYNGIPELDFNNISALNADRLSSVGSSKTYVYSDSLSWNKGRHDFRFGFDISTLESISALGFNGADNYGTFQYNTQASAGLFTGVDFADFLSGLPYQTFYDVVSQDNDGKSTHYNFFAQDQWKLNDRLTLSYGLRYELHPGYYDVHGDIGNFDPTVGNSGASIYPDGHADLLNTDFLASANACSPYGSTSGGATINGAACMPVLSNSQGGYPAGLKKYPHLRFMPRFGFAYKPFNNDKTSIRGGYGLYNNNLLGSSFYSLTGTLQAGTTQYTNTLVNGTPGYQWPNIFAGAGNGGGTTNYGQDYFGTANSIDWKDPYTHQWSLSVDHSIGSGYAARVSYIGSETIHLVYAPDENTLPFSNTISANNQPLSDRRFPNWGRINTRDTSATASYHSLQAEVSHRFQRGFQFDSSYTYAKALADNEGPASNGGFAGENGGSRATSILDRHADYGDVFGTRRNRWNTTMVYELPFGRGKQFGANISRLVDLAFGGWRISNIFLWQSGPFETPYFGSGQGDPSGTGSGLNGTQTGFDGGHRNQYPDRVAGVSIKPSNRSRNGWVNTAAFTCPGLPGYVVNTGQACTTGLGDVRNSDGTVTHYGAPIGRFGNARVGSIVGPGTVNLSSGVSKVFAITERVNLRAEGTFTNVLNHTNLGDPNLDISSTTFGRITGTIGSDNGGARSGQVSMRLDF
jgi:hypothetical protein